jgi:hypothetical protein
MGRLLLYLYVGVRSKEVQSPWNCSRHLIVALQINIQLGLLKPWKMGNPLSFIHWSVVGEPRKETRSGVVMATSVPRLRRKPGEETRNGLALSWQLQFRTCVVLLGLLKIFCEVSIHSYSCCCLFDYSIVVCFYIVFCWIHSIYTEWGQKNFTLSTWYR